jgi:tetratricopeptide (TPR) repeat protein
MTKKQKTVLRDSLNNMIRQQAIHLMATYSANNPNSNRRMISPRDPFGKLLQELMPRQQFSEDVANFLKQTLTNWGGITSSIEQYRQTVVAQRHSYQQMAGAGMHQIHNTSSTVSKKGGSGGEGRRTNIGTSWNNDLQQISFSDLVLYHTAKGKYIEGKIVGEAIQPIVGGTVLIQEQDTQKTMLICFYNLLPDGISGADAEPYLKAEFPMGATLRVAEPFSKIFNDGQRGVRVDTPSELHVLRDSSDTTSTSSLTEAKAAGNQYVKQEKYLAATDSYLKGLHSSEESEFVATLLSNRSQAHLFMNDWGQALCDAAASLTIRPNNEKTWVRYKKCLDHLLTNRGTKKRSLFGELLCDLPVLTSTSKTTDMSKAKRFKEEGNAMYKKQEYEEAIDNYSKALEACGETTRAILSNWALCSLKLRNFGDIIAATTASLRIGIDEKALFRLLQVCCFLGEYDLALKGLDEFDPAMKKTPSASSFAELEKDLKRCIKYREVMITGKARCVEDVRELVENTPSCIGNWVSPHIEMFLTKSNENGLRAKADLPAGSAVLVEWPVLSEEYDRENSNKRSFFTNITDNKTLRTGSSALLQPTVVTRLRREALLARILSKLPDGTSTAEDCSISDLLVNIEMFTFLLPTHRDYMRDQTVEELTSYRVESILDLNCHGTSSSEDKMKIKAVNNTSLYPLVTMIKRSTNPNCSYAPNTQKFLLTLLTLKDIKAGEELTIMYHKDNKFASETTWGMP